jgi:alpha-soluble NSF attachment protein
MRQGEKDEASSAYLNASKALKKVDPAKACETLVQAITLLTERGRFQTGNLKTI